MTINIPHIFIVMKGELNPKLKEGDKVICYHMDGETGVPPGTKGTVRRVSRDPFEPNGDESIIEVNWDNGSTLALVSSTDAWKKVFEEIQEQTLSPEYNFFNTNPELFEHFDWRFLNKYLFKLRESGVINMFQAAPFLYSGKQWVDRYYGENQEDNEPFQELLEMADDAKDKMVQGLVKYMSSKNMGMDDMDRVNHLLHKLAIKISQLYMIFA
jgi:hypothetical protein